MKLQKVFWQNVALAVAVTVAVAMLLASAAPPAHAQAAQSNSPVATSAVDKPYLVEWVYKVKWGYADEFWEIFKKYQIATLDREKALGYVTSYSVYRPGLHTGEDTRWEYRVVITYKNQASSSHGGEVEKQLFPDQATQKREENRRWQITEAHYDLPIRVIDPNGDGGE
jgi:hypothetical protein